MSKKRKSKRVTVSRVKTGKGRVIAVIALMAMLSVTGLLVARRASLWGTGSPDPNVEPGMYNPAAPQSSPTLAKEYIYAGGKLIATEEPQGAPSCTYSLNPTSQSFASSGGTGSFGVTTQAGCMWNATSNATSWLTITSGSPGSGNGTVGYSVASNSGAARNGTITVEGQTFTVTQSAASSCSFSISPTSQSYGASGGSGNVIVTVLTGTGCNWNATSNVSWIIITSGSSGTDNGTVGYSVATNSGAARVGTMTIAGQTFTVNQDAAVGCSFSINPTSKSFTSAGGTDSVGVTTQTGCNWSASSNVSWITITSGSSGSGNGTVNYSVASNSGAARNGTMTIAGQTFTVNQDAAGGGSTAHSLSLDGASQYVDAPNSSTLNITGAITVEAWIKTNSAATKQTIISRFSTTVTKGTNGGYRLRITNTGQVIFATYTNANTFVEATSSTSITAGVWTHVAGVFNGSFMRVYINGVERAKVSSTSGPQTGTSNLKIGMNPDGIQKFDGLLDEVRVTAAAVYTSNFTPQASLTSVGGTAGLWKFDNQTAADTSGNNNNGTLFGSPAFSTDVPGGGGAMNLNSDGQKDAIIAAAPSKNEPKMGFRQKLWMWLEVGYGIMSRASPLV